MEKRPLALHAAMQRETGLPQEGIGRGQPLRRKPRGDAEKPIHDREDHLAAQPAESGRGRLEISHQPVRRRRRAPADRRNDSLQLLRAKTVEKKIRRDQIVRFARGRRPRRRG